jgi:nicotinamidase-related amidase
VTVLGESRIPSDTPWAALLSDDERRVIDQGGYGVDQALGTRFALLLVDVQRSVIGLDVPILEQQATWPSGIGAPAWAATRRLATTAAAARAAGVRVIFTRLVSSLEGGSLLGMHDGRIRRNPAAVGDPGTEFVETLQPGPGDTVLDKRFPSAFFGTPLITLLFKQRIDTVILGGGSTSGCVRATAVDAASLGLNVGVLSDGTFDRIAVSHATALLDLWMKTSIVLTCDEAVGYFKDSKEME